MRRFVLDRRRPRRSAEPVRQRLRLRSRRRRSHRLHLNHRCRSYAGGRADLIRPAEYRMIRLHPPAEHHFINCIGRLRAAVLGANDGIVSTASLIVGVAAAAATQNDVVIAGVAGLVAGAMSMAAGEYVSVSSQSNTEQELGISEITTRAPYASRTDIGRIIYRRRGHALAHGCHIARRCARPSHVGCVIGLSCCSGGDRSKSRRGKRSARHSPSDYSGARWQWLSPPVLVGALYEKWEQRQRFRRRI